jgi:hypothetical protein
MVEQIALEELYSQPLVAELIHENKTLKKQVQMSEKPEIDDINNISLPYTITDHLLIDQGVHNDVDYKTQILRMAVEQHEGLSIFLDHHDNNTGGTVETWVGEIKNPQWSDEKEGIVGDIDIVDPKTAMAIAYGAKFGVSATVDVDQQESLSGSGPAIAMAPIFKSYSLVITPAVRGTMLNQELKEEEKEEDKMTEELNLKDDLKPAMETLDDAIKRATAKRDNDILVSLRQTKAILTKLAGSTYPYPGKDETMDEELESRFNSIDEAILQLMPEQKEEKSEELELVETENNKMKAQLEAIRLEKLAAYAGVIIAKETRLGLITDDDADTRRKELEAMDLDALKAVEQNVDKTIQILEKEDKKEKDNEDAKPKSQKILEKKDEKGKDEDYDRKLLEVMVKEQGTDRMELGGY